MLPQGISRTGLALTANVPGVGRPGPLPPVGQPQIPLSQKPQGGGISPTQTYGDTESEKLWRAKREADRAMGKPIMEDYISRGQFNLASYKQLLENGGWSPSELARILLAASSKGSQQFGFREMGRIAYERDMRAWEEAQLAAARSKAETEALTGKSKADIAARLSETRRAEEEESADRKKKHLARQLECRERAANSSLPNCTREEWNEFA